MAKRPSSERHRHQPVEEARHLGERVRRLRLEKGFSFDAFVEEVGLGRGYVSELERGLVVPSLTALHKLASALELTVADLLCGDTPRDRLYELMRTLPAPQLAELSLHALQLRVSAGLPARIVEGTAGERYISALPLYNVRPSAGAWSEPQRPAIEAWVEPPRGVAVRKGLFVVQVSGASMEPKIPDGAFCLCERPWPAPDPGQIGLFVVHDRADPEAGRFTIKEYAPSVVGARVRGALRSRNPRYSALAPTGDERAFARVVRVLR